MESERETQEDQEESQGFFSEKAIEEIQRLLGTVVMDDEQIPEVMMQDMDFSDPIYIKNFLTFLHGDARKDPKVHAHCIKYILNQIQMNRDRQVVRNRNFTNPVHSGVKYGFYLGDLDSVQAKQHIKNREIELHSISKQLGIQIKLTKQLAFASINEISKVLYYGRDKWGDTKITKWLRSIKPSQDFEGGMLEPYKAIIPVLPKKVNSYLDYGAGNGNGACQIKDYFELSFDNANVWDIVNYISSDNVNKVKFVSDSSTRTYDLVTMVNVMHHVSDISTLLDEVMLYVSPGGTLIIKDHFLSSVNKILCSLVHDCYEPDKAENIYTHKLAEIVRYMITNGWKVTYMEIPDSDLGDMILVCKYQNSNNDSLVETLVDKVAEMSNEIKKLQNRCKELEKRSEVREDREEVDRMPVVNRYDLVGHTPEKMHRVDKYRIKENQEYHYGRARGNRGFQTSNRYRDRDRSYNNDKYSYGRQKKEEVSTEECKPQYKVRNLTQENYDNAKNNPDDNKNIVEAQVGRKPKEKFVPRMRYKD